MAVKTISEALKRLNPEYLIAAQGREAYDALAKLFGYDQPQAPAGILGPTDAERDAMVNAMAPGGQATPQTMDAVRATRERFRSLPQDDPNWRPPDSANYQQQLDAQRAAIPQNTEMMLRALQAENPYVVKAALNQIPKELFPTQATQSGSQTYKLVAPKTEPRNPLEWREVVRFDANGNPHYTGVFERIKPDRPLVNVNTGQPEFDRTVWDAAEEARTNMIGTEDLMKRISDPSLDWSAEKGWEGIAKTYARQFFGDENAIDRMKVEFTNRVNERVIGTLPPGPASDKDMAIIMKGFPKEGSSKETMLEFLRAVYRVQFIANEYERYKLRAEEEILSGRSTPEQSLRRWQDEIGPALYDQVLQKYPAEIPRQEPPVRADPPAGARVFGG